MTFNSFFSDMLGVVVLSIFLIGCQAQSDNLVVQLHDGKVRGTTITSPGGNTFYTWRHIPFAKPPLGDLRFQPPERPNIWHHILDGSKDSMACMFIGTYEGDPKPTYGNSEDCLYISVYSPVEPNSSLRLPVMFSIYGGGFITGSSDSSFLDPAPFMEEDVIIVSFNYRLGIFGFLSTQDDILPGNVALKDQHQALLWTKENIAFFGGNPDDITIFGESAGAFSVAYHLTSSMSRNLNSAKDLAAAYDMNTNLLMPDFCNLKAGVSVEDISEEIKMEYVGNGSFVDNVGSLIAYKSENEFLRSSLKHATLQSKYAAVYFYQFSFIGTCSINRPGISGCGGVAHADDVPYFFNVSSRPIETDADYLTRRRLINLWVNFARTKNPTPDDDSSEILQNVKWEPFTKTELQYLDIGDNLKI